MAKCIHATNVNALDHVIPASCVDRPTLTSMIWQSCCAQGVAGGPYNGFSSYIKDSKHCQQNIICWRCRPAWRHKHAVQWCHSVLATRHLCACI